MKTKEALKLLRANADENALFISDPIGGDQIHILTEDNGNRIIEPPKTATGTQFGTCQEFLDTLDFEIYDGDGPDVYI